MDDKLREAIANVFIHEQDGRNAYELADVILALFRAHGWRPFTKEVPYCPVCGKTANMLGTRDCPIPYHDSMISPF